MVLASAGRTSSGIDVRLQAAAQADEGAVGPPGGPEALDRVTDARRRQLPGDGHGGDGEDLRDDPRPEAEGDVQRPKGDPVARRPRRRRGRGVGARPVGQEVDLPVVDLVEAVPGRRRRRRAAERPTRPSSPDARGAGRGGRGGRRRGRRPPVAAAPRRTTELCPLTPPAPGGSGPEGRRGRAAPGGGCRRRSPPGRASPAGAGPAMPAGFIGDGEPALSGARAAADGGQGGRGGCRPCHRRPSARRETASAGNRRRTRVVSGSRAGMPRPAAEPGHPRPPRKGAGARHEGEDGVLLGEEGDGGEATTDAEQPTGATGGAAGGDEGADGGGGQGHGRRHRVEELTGTGGGAVLEEEQQAERGHGRRDGDDDADHEESPARRHAAPARRVVRLGLGFACCG